MGVYITDTDSEYVNEKEQTQTTTARKQSHCPFVWLKQAFSNHREKREQQYRPRIDAIRKQINKSREKVKRSGECDWQGTTSTEQRRSLWERGLVDGFLWFNGYVFNTSHRYKITTSNPRTGSEKAVVLDFRTPEGREEAFTWWDTKYQAHMEKTARVLNDYKMWEELFQVYIKQHRCNQRELLLKGTGKIVWLKTRLEELPN